MKEAEIKGIIMTWRAAKRQRKLTGCAEGTAGGELSYPGSTTPQCGKPGTHLPQRWDLRFPAFAAWCTTALHQRPHLSRITYRNVECSWLCALQSQ